MNTKNDNSKLYALTIGLFIVCVGIYNSVVINSSSEISDSDMKFVKRLDEVYGVTVPGRHVATTTHWQKVVSTPKVSFVKKEAKNFIPPVSTIQKNSESTQENPTDPAVDAAVLEELNLSLVEVINPKKWQNGLNNSQFNGSLMTNNGVIEGLSVSLPNGEGLSVSFSELTGNVFEYDIDGELYSGMMYQVDQNAYMVTLTNGPLEGTRLRFTAAQSEQEQFQNDQILAENKVDVGSFGGQEEVIQEEIVTQDQMIQKEALGVEGFNL
jgi:hypothetical protein